MKGKQTKLHAFFLIVLIILAKTILIQASQDEETNVSYVPDSIFHDLYVVVIGDGCVMDGDMEIRNGTNIYELKSKSQKTFSVIADEGSRLKSIIYKGMDITESLRNDSQLTIISPNHSTVLLITFEKKQTNEEQQNPNEIPTDTINPVPIIPPITDDEHKEEIIVTIIVKDIPLDVVEKGINDEMIKSHIICSKDFTILSHNIQNRPGRYEIVIQLADGSVQTLQIEVKDNDKERKDDRGEKKECYWHLLILLITSMYTVYMMSGIYKNTRKIKELKKEIENTFWEEETHEN